MEHLTRRLAILIATGAALAGCDTTSSHSPTDMSSADLDFVTAAFNIIEFDRQECTLAATQAKSPAVRALAAQFLQQANAFDMRLRSITEAANVQPPTVLRTDLRVRVAHLRLNQGLDFDRSFIEDQIASHTDALDMQDRMSHTQGAHPQLQALAKEGLELLRENLGKLRVLQAQLALGDHR